MPVDFISDLHIHTCLSPCAELEMTPRAIVERAASLGINILAVCDHNSAENAAVTEYLARKKGIRVIPGIEINSSEEVHLLSLFGDLEKALHIQSLVYESLPPEENDEDAFGMQVVVNESDEVLGFNRRLLIGASSLPLAKIVELVHASGGIAIPSHIDREGFGIIGQLGFIPEEVDFDALEMSWRITSSDAQEKFAPYAHLPWISSSDAHSLHDIGRRTTTCLMYHATFEEFCLALRGVDGRKVTF